MDEKSIQSVAQELKEFHLMQQNRKIIAKPIIHCNFMATLKNIYYDPVPLDRLNESGISWILLHEEGHLVLPQEKYSHKLWLCFVWLLSCIGLSFLFRDDLIIIWIFFWFILSLIDKRFFYSSMWNDEFSADEYAIKGLFLIRPELVSWDEMNSALNTLTECQKKRKAPLLIQIIRILYRNLGIRTHPPNDVRVNAAQALFNKYKVKRDSSLPS